MTACTALLMALWCCEWSAGTGDGCRKDRRGRPSSVGVRDRRTGDTRAGEDAGAVNAAIGSPGARKPSSLEDFSSIAKSLSLDSSGAPHRAPHLAAPARSVSRSSFLSDASGASDDGDDEELAAAFSGPLSSALPPPKRAGGVWHSRVPRGRLYTPPVTAIRCSTATLLLTMMYLLALTVILPTTIGTPALPIVLPIFSGLYVLSIIEWRFLWSWCYETRGADVTRHVALSASDSYDEELGFEEADEEGGGVSLRVEPEGGWSSTFATVAEEEEDSLRLETVGGE
ncbi:hypothetical protein TeGR_g11512 [Tetraparma gracilis]|uniref:Uncharacterized protein n=1 Tax=Tetraparma gracilis TaxID=2962635 RepID=A0ABQ6M602_9STRA|nr:hypothetical protein TeGR_g11512 [Tetraparma gracilis]